MYAVLNLAMNSNQFLSVALHIMRKSSTWLARAHATSASAPRTTQVHAPLRFGHLRSDAQRLRAVLRCDTGIATNAHGTTTAMRGRCRRRRPADSRATQSSHLPGTPGRRAPEARRTWKRSRRALQQRCATFGTRPWPTEHRRLYGPQRLQAGRVAGGACCLSQCSRRLPALPSASRGRSRRMPPASRALRSTAYSTSPRPKGRAACRCDPRRSRSV